MTKGYYVIEAEVWCESGNVSGAGIYVSGVGSNANLMMGSDADLEGNTGAGGAGVRRWAKLIYYGASESSTFYALTGWSGLGSVTAKTLTWYRASIRPASQAEVNGNQAKADVSTLSATVTTQQTALADLSGKAYSRYMVEANANGVISGIYLVSSSGSAGVAISAFKVKANVFSIVSPDLAATKIPFVYDAVAGKLVLNEVVARAANIEDLAVTTLKIGDIAVTTEKITQGAVNVPVTSSHGSILQPVVGLSYVSATLTLKAGQKVFLTYRADVLYPSSRVSTIFQLYRDATLIDQTTTSFDGQNRVAMICIGSDTVPSDGNYTYSVKYDSANKQSITVNGVPGFKIPAALENGLFILNIYKV